MFRKVMAAVDVRRGAANAPICAMAGEICRLAGAELFFVSIRPEDADDPAETFAQEVETFAAAELERLELKGGWLALADDAVDDGLARAVAELKPDLVVMGPHAPRWFELLTGEALRDFVATSEASVLIAKSEAVAT